MQSLHRTNHTKRIVIFVIIVLVIGWFDPFGVKEYVRSSLNTVLQPIVRIGHGVGGRFYSVWDLLFSIGTLHEENQLLHQRVQQLEAQEAVTQDVMKENDELRNLLAIAPREKYDLVGAEVVMRDSLGGNQWVMIDRGRADGLREDQTVIVNDGVYVGRISDVDEHTAYVQLVTHPEHIVNVTGNTSGAEAIMRGNHGLSAVVEDIKKDVHVDEGEVFITSQIGNRVPRGFFVGAIHNVTTSPDALFQTGSIVPAVSLDDLHIVFIVNVQQS